MNFHHCYIDSDYSESVAKHSWRLSLMIVCYANKLDREVDILKCLKMAIIYDLAKAIICRIDAN